MKMTSMLFYLLPTLGLLLLLLNYGYGKPQYNDFVQVAFTIITTFYVILNIPFIFGYSYSTRVSSKIDYSPTASISSSEWRQIYPVSNYNNAHKGDARISDRKKQAYVNMDNVDKMPVCGHCGDDPEPLTQNDNLNFRWPARGRIIHSFSPGENDGINIILAEGSPIKAAEAGEVAYAGEELTGYGKIVVIRHYNGFVSAYAHNSELTVKKYDKIIRGQIIAMSGKSGYVSKPQLHFEMRIGSIPVNPVKYLK